MLPSSGAYFANDSERRTVFVNASTLLTHTDPKALEAARMAADCAAFATNEEMRRDVILSRMNELGASPEWRLPLQQIEKSLKAGMTVRQFADETGFSKGVSGYAVHTMTMVLFIWLRHRGDFSEIVRECIACGGDTDSVAAIAGGISGAETDAFDSRWVEQLSDFPYTVDYITRLGTALAQSERNRPVKPPSVAKWLIIPRNILFLLVVVLHGFRRLLPPY